MVQGAFRRTIREYFCVPWRHKRMPFFLGSSDTHALTEKFPTGDSVGFASLRRSLVCTLKQIPPWKDFFWERCSWASPVLRYLSKNLIVSQIPLHSVVIREAKDGLWQDQGRWSLFGYFLPSFGDWYFGSVPALSFISGSHGAKCAIMQ